MATLLALVMRLTLLPATASAAEDDFVIDAEGVLIKYTGPGGEVIIPEGVTGIDEGAFYGCTGLTGVTISGDVTSIGSYAFHGCTSLTSVTIPEGVTVIGEAAFYRCSNLTVYGTEGSRAEQYCMANDISFVVGVAPGTAQKGTLESIGGQCVTWDITSRGEVSMTLPGATEAEEAILVVCYDTSGRFTRVKWVTAQSPSTRIDPATPNVRLFWLGAEGTPQSSSVTVWGKYTE